jgi:hypothetical protein
MSNKKVAFYSPHLSVRGTEVAMYDYAHYNETILGNTSIIIHEPTDHRNDATAVQKFKSRFPVFGIESFTASAGFSNRAEFVNNRLNTVLAEQSCDAIYIIKGGWNDGLQPTACKSLIHCIATPPASEKHGDVYAYGSYWLSDHCSQGTLPAVPYMVDLPDVDGNLRSELGIPDTAIVFGRNGGSDSFDIQWAKYVVSEVVNAKPDVYFLFQNTDKFYDHPRVIHLPMNADLVYKTKFINSCDAMLHARDIGESFGLACGEFSIRNKPVITWSGSKERNHIYILGDRGMYYSNPQELFDLLMNFSKPSPSEDLNCYREYNPSTIMKIFDQVFLQS